MRLGEATAPHGATCKLKYQQHVDGNGKTCGQPLRDDDESCWHRLVCDCAVARLRPHRALCTACGRSLRAAGAEVDYERHVPHLYQWQEESRRHKEAILDCVIVWLGDHALRTYDVSVACPMAERAFHTSRKPGATAAKRERDKAARYDCTVRPFMP